MVIARFKSQNRVRKLLSEEGLEPGTIDAEICISHAFEVTSGTPEPMVQHDLTEPFVARELEPEPVSYTHLTLPTKA